MKDKIINILGSEWTVRYANSANDRTFANDRECGGYMDPSTNTIVMSDESELRMNPYHAEDLENIAKKSLRHELIHAFLYECGLCENSGWACNEEFVDWLAIQFEKLIWVFDQAGALDCVDEEDDEGADNNVGESFYDDLCNHVRQRAADINKAPEEAKPASMEFDDLKLLNGIWRHLQMLLDAAAKPENQARIVEFNAAICRTAELLESI